MLRPSIASCGIDRAQIQRRHKVDEKALEYARAFSPQNEIVRQYLATVLGFPLPGELLHALAQSSNVAMEDAHAIIRGYIEAVFLNRGLRD
ncbi:MAG: hypothetical protein ACYDC6_12275 [Acidobacteriaceae bacterium]